MGLFIDWKKGMISSNKILVGNKRFRVYYHITELGQKYLISAINVFNKIYSGANVIFNRGLENEKRN